jgi:NodT family efflux transporter outer membrane factor (OMF) lipoprotein
MIDLKYKSTLLHIALFSGMLLSACAVPKKTQLPELQPLPAKFSASTDSLQNIGIITRDSFFRDPHLRAIISEVLSRNPDMHIAMQRIQAAGAWLKMSKGALLPAVAINGASSATRFGKYTMEGVGNFDTNLSPNIDDDQRIGTRPTMDFWLGLSASWEIDLWGKLRKMKEAAAHRFMASEQAADMLKSMLVAQTALLYYELTALDKEVTVMEENIKLQERALEIVEVQKEAGRATELAVQQFKAQLFNSRGYLRAVQQQIAEAENSLNALAGRYEGKIARSTFQPLTLAMNKGIGSGFPAAILQNRPDIMQAESEMIAADADMAAARAAFFPNVNLSAYTAFNAFKGSLLFSASSLGYQLLGGLTAPLFQKHQIRSQYRIAGANRQESFHNYERTVLNAYKEVLNHLSNIRTLDERSALKQKEVSALENGVNISEDLYINGYASYLEIVAAQKSKLEAELQLIDLRREEIYSAIHLYKSLGGGWR